MATLVIQSRNISDFQDRSAFWTRTPYNAQMVGRLRHVGEPAVVAGVYFFRIPGTAGTEPGPTCLLDQAEEYRDVTDCFLGGIPIGSGGKKARTT